jgi:hypothetical protein
MQYSANSVFNQKPQFSKKVRVNQHPQDEQHENAKCQGRRWSHRKKIERFGKDNFDHL